MRNLLKYIIYTILLSMTRMHTVFAETKPIAAHIIDFLCNPEVYTLNGKQADKNNDLIGILKGLHQDDEIALNNGKYAVNFISKETGKIAIELNDKTQLLNISKAISVQIDDTSTCPPYLYTLIHNGQESSVTREMQLEAGNRLQINPETVLLRLQFGNNSIQEVKYKELPYRVKSLGEIPTLGKNLTAYFEELIGLLTRQHENELQKLVSLSRRSGNDEKFSVKIPNKQWLLVEGERPLYLAWQGGKPPYQVRVICQEETRLDEKLETQQLVVKTVLPTGICRVLFEDSAKQKIEYPLTVVASQPPEMPDADTVVDTNMRQVLQAHWLSEQENGQWIFEAYQQLSEIADTYPPAHLLREMLFKP